MQQLTFTEQGTGPGVLLIHGTASTQRAWEPQVSLLVQAGYRVITVDLPGYGQSHGECSLAACIAGVQGVCQITQPHVVVGYSLGAVVALEVSLRQAVQGLILICPAILIPRATCLFYDWVTGWPLDALASYGTWIKPLVSPMSRIALEQNPQTIRELWPSLRDWSCTNQAERFRKLTVPVYVACGQWDHIAPPWILEPWVRSLPQGEFRVLKGRHRPMESDTRAFDQWLIHALKAIDKNLSRL